MTKAPFNSSSPGKIAIAAITAVVVVGSVAAVKITSNSLWETFVTVVQAQTTEEVGARIGVVEQNQMQNNIAIERNNTVINNLVTTQRALVMEVGDLKNIINRKSEEDKNNTEAILKAIEGLR
jgi:hypothetical protein